MVKKIFILVLIVCVVGVVFVIRSRLNSPMQIVTIGSTTIAVDVADTEALRNRGLSGRSDLPGGDSVSPDTYPQSFTPGEPARYALEIPAGFAQAHGIAEGDVLVRQ
ncbi:MAG: hypothetical protein UY42_C0026G0007 [Parcubacteria group bacterium GW2011_GWA2_49_16]|nr:MAG: hypothetical protein UY42_C0026G0007 [Parcubacteria group bacterium GW2011_GWA2_49_16]